MNRSFIAATGPPPLIESGLGLAVNSGFIYWSTGVSIGRANLDGTDVNPSFIPGVPPLVFLALAIDGAHIYWIDVNGSIGRANLDGTDVNRSFISGISVGGFGLAVNSGFIYWTAPGSIGRANLDGANVIQSFISPVDVPSALAVDPSFVYWTNSTSGSIGRAKLDGTDVNQDFIADASVGGFFGGGLAVVSPPVSISCGQPGIASLAMIGLAGIARGARRFRV